MLKKLLTGALALPIISTVAFAQDLSLTLNLPENDANLGNIRVGVFTSQANFDDRDPVIGLEQAAVGGINTVTIPDLPAGTYGISLYLDRNGNEKLDANLFGAPTEPYGFSLDPKIGFSAPSFDEFGFVYGGKGGTLTVELNGI